MTDGFDLNSPLVCEGVVGDGCGGGRIFFVEDQKLQVYDPFTKETMVLLTKLPLIKKIEKHSCIITLFAHKKSIEFDLSTVK